MSKGVASYFIIISFIFVPALALLMIGAFAPTLFDLLFATILSTVAYLVFAKLTGLDKLLVLAGSIIKGKKK